MKIGILTFHSQLNYGGVLQCWALQTALEKMGHEVVIIDREFEHQIRSFRAIFKGWSLLVWIKFIVKCLLRRPDVYLVLRYFRTVLFVKKNLHLTNYSFKEWKEAPKNLGIDLIVVGSDQVWNAVWNRLDIYLLEGAPRIPAIGYAISLGMKKIPPECINTYRKATKIFSSVSVREKDAGELLSFVGFNCYHVADPVLLINYDNMKTSEKGGIVCYFIGDEIREDESLYLLEKFAEKLKLYVTVYTHKQIISGAKRFRKIKMYYSAGPNEFMNGIATAKYVLSDSFHALMFSCVLGKNVRIVRPHDGNAREKMFSRIEEFCQEYIKGECIFDNIQTSLSSFESGNIVTIKNVELKKFIMNSKDWLESSICSAKK